MKYIESHGIRLSKLQLGTVQLGMTYGLGEDKAKPSEEKAIGILERAMELAADPYIDDLEAIQMLGEGWVAEETLAIAVYCCQKHADDFAAALVASVNHSGDSDSTGAVAGNIMGALLGASAIPNQYTKDLEMKDLILDIAERLYQATK